MAYWISGSSTPFDDTLKITTTLGLNTATTGGVDTRPIDGLRQGVELNTIDKFFVTTQPKLWGGSIKFDGRVSHLNETYTYGQSVSFADFFGKSQFDDRLRKFDPVLYVELGGAYPFPLLFNDGPQDQEENTVEPLTIPFKKNSPESVGYIVKSIHASIENGQDNTFTGTTLLSNFIEFGVPNGCKQFLEQGEQRLGDSFSGSISVPGYTSTAEQKIKPFIDQKNEHIVNQLSGFNDSEINGVLLGLEGYIQGNNFLPFNHRSAVAGCDIYGPNQARYGTDSLAFRNRIRGS